MPLHERLSSIDSMQSSVSLDGIAEIFMQLVKFRRGCPSVHLNKTRFNTLNQSATPFTLSQSQKMTGRGKGGRGLGKKPLVTKKTKTERREQRRIDKQEKKDRFDVTKMSAEDKEHFITFGRYGFLRTKDCESCGGTGDGRNGEMCECMCGSCCQEKHDCGGCDYYSCDDSSSDNSGSDSDNSNDSKSSESEKESESEHEA